MKPAGRLLRPARHYIYILLSFISGRPRIRTWIFGFSVRHIDHLCQRPIFRYKDKLDFLLISGENCKEPNSGPIENRTLPSVVQGPIASLVHVSPNNVIEN